MSRGSNIVTRWVTVFPSITAIRTYPRVSSCSGSCWAAGARGRPSGRGAAWAAGSSSAFKSGYTKISMVTLHTSLVQSYLINTSNTDPTLTVLNKPFTDKIGVISLSVCTLSTPMIECARQDSTVGTNLPSDMLSEHCRTRMSGQRERFLLEMGNKKSP